MFFEGWDDALIGACPGESRLVFIPYELAYGEKGVENFVPPKSNLVLQIEILKVCSRVLNFLDRISSGGFNGWKQKTKCKLMSACGTESTFSAFSTTQGCNLF